MIFDIDAIKKIKRNTEIISKALLLTILFSCSKDDSINCVPISFPDAYEYPIKSGFKSG